jgi:hypothetical protein
MRTPKPTASAPATPRRRTATRRDGLRQIRIWIPDIDPETFRAEAHRQSLLAASSPGAKEDQDFVDAISDPLPTE